MKMPFSRIFSRIVPAEGLKIRGAISNARYFDEKGFASNSNPNMGGGNAPMLPCFPPALQDISRKWVQFFKAL